MKVKLKEIISDFIVPMRDKPKVFDGSIPWCRIEDISGKYLIDSKSNQRVSNETVKKMGLKVYPINTLLFSCSATIGVTAITKAPLCTNQTFIGLFPGPNLDVEFLYYYLGKIGSRQRQAASITTIPYLSRRFFEELVINLPTKLSEQKKISAVLASLDSKIELNNRINIELETIAKTLYDYWFVQFDFPNKNGKPYKSSGGKMVWNEDLKREIPEGWEVKSIDECCKIVDCLHSKKPEMKFEREEFYLLQLENILDNGLVDISNKYFVSQNDYFKWTSRIEVKENDILITNAGRVAANAQIPKEIVTGIGRNITAIRPDSISPTYLFQSFRGVDILKQIKSNTDSGAFFQSFNVKGIKRLKFLIPENTIENKFEQLAYSWRRKRELNLAENQKLASLRDWLLPMLMNGQVKVN